MRWAEPELAYALADSGAKVLFTDRDPGALGGLVERVVRIDTGEYEALLESAAESDLGRDGAAGADAAVTEDSLAGLFYTGGTTGASKGVMLTHRNLLANTFNIQMLAPMTIDDTYLVMAPLFHAAGSVSVLQSLYVGARQVVVPAFDPALALDLMEREAVTVTLAVPTMVAGHGGGAAGPAPPDLPADDGPRRLAHRHGGRAAGHEGLPGHRAGPPLRGDRDRAAGDRAAPRGDLLDTPREKSAGQAVVGVEVVIRGLDGRPLPDGEPGEVTTRGNNIMAGYWAKPEQTAAALRDGWYWTGDVGRLDEEGYLYLLDRSKDMIVSGGENVYCTEVEDALYTHPQVLEATVFGIPDERWGEAVHAVVVPRGEVAADELVAHCRTRIAGYKVPRSISFQSDPLPKSGPGKVLKRELRASYWEGREGSIA